MLEFCDFEKQYYFNSSYSTWIKLNQLGLDNNMWPLFVTEMHTNPVRLNCANCDTHTTEAVLRDQAIRKTLFAWL